MLRLQVRVEVSRALKFLLCFRNLALPLQRLG
jgi:hypothetical protein